MMSACRWCGRTDTWHCRNTRDMTDMAIDGDETCFEELAKVGCGEAGERYVRLNKAARAKERHAHAHTLNKEQR